MLFVRYLCSGRALFGGVFRVCGVFCLWRVVFACDGVCFFCVAFICFADCFVCNSRLFVTCLIFGFIGLQFSLSVWNAYLWCALFVAGSVCFVASACFVGGVFRWRRSLIVVFNCLCRCLFTARLCHCCYYGVLHL